MSREKNIETVESFINALQRNDLSLAPLAEDVYFDDPIAGKNHGAENFKSFVSGFLLAMSGARILNHVCEGEYVVTHWEADGVFGQVAIIEKFRIQNEEITEITAFFDPRPILGS